ncbi:MAG: type II toxin-antitoxin system VapC family toxin [Pseudomonadota bacterium]
MRFLIDTQALLWWLKDSQRLGPRARSRIASGDPVVSPVVPWEIAIKTSLGKLVGDVGQICSAISEGNFSTLGFTNAHCVTLAALPFHHRDPFDRMLVSQAMVEGLPILTSDDKISLYGPKVLSAER